MLKKSAIKTLLNPSTNGRGVYHSTTIRSECCTIA